MFASFDYLLEEKLKIEMKGIMHVNLDTPNGMSKGFIQGDLLFDQDAPILIDSIKRTLYDSNPLELENYENLGMLGILHEYNSRSGKFQICYYLQNSNSLSVLERLKYDY